MNKMYRNKTILSNLTDEANISSMCIGSKPTNLMAPYTSYVNHANTFNVFPKIEIKTEEPEEPDGPYAPIPMLDNIMPKREEFDNSEFSDDASLEHNNESTVPTALGLLPTSYLKDNISRKAKLPKHTEFSDSALAYSRKRKNDFDSVYEELTISKPETLTVPATGQPKIKSDSNKTTAEQIFGFLRCVGPQKWVVSEWFQSFLDLPILNEVNNFQFRLDQIIPPGLKIGLTLYEWTYLRSTMGAVRRFSPEFVQAERYEWERIRVIMRLLQTKSTGYVRSIDIMDGIPDQIPRVLANGTEVQAIIRNPFRGIHNGTIICFEEPVWAYTVRFPAFEEMGDSLIPDFQLMTTRSHGTLSLQSVRIENEYQENYQFKVGDGDCVNGYSSKDLLSFLELKRINRLHREQLLRISKLHDKIQTFALKQSVYMKSMEDEFRFWLEHNLDSDFLRQYACIMLTIEKLDAVLMRHMEEVEKFRDDLQHLITPLLSECSNEELVERCRVSCDVYMLETYQKPITKRLWSKIGKILMILKFLQAGGIHERGIYVLKCHLHNILFATDGESAHVFGNIVIPLIETLLQEIEILKALKLSKFAVGTRTT